MINKEKKNYMLHIQLISKVNNYLLASNTQLGMIHRLHLRNILHIKKDITSIFHQFINNSLTGMINTQKNYKLNKRVDIVGIGLMHLNNIQFDSLNKLMSQSFHKIYNLKLNLRTSHRNFHLSIDLLHMKDIQKKNYK